MAGQSAKPSTTCANSCRQNTEQLLWTKWGQQVPRSESTRILAELQGARAQFAAYFTDLRDEQLDARSAPAHHSSPRDVIQRALEGETQSMDLIRRALSR